MVRVRACTVVSCKYASLPPFATLALLQITGAHTRDATFSLAITPSLLVSRPQLCVEDNAFDDFAVAIWYMWQSHVEIEGYSDMYFDRIAVFEVPYH